jgi:hypothetical protein
MIQADDPWARCLQLMDEYHVRVCAVEALPNFNEAHRFAKARDGKVFVIHYVDLVDQVVLWGDRPRDKVTIRKVDEAVRSRWSATVDQYKAMSWALGQWTSGAVATPDPRALVQRVREKGVEVPRELLREYVWHHLQHVALVTEPIEGREAERKYRRAVKKVGIDPHFAYTWMLLCIAWARVFGTEKMLLVDPMHHAEPTPPADAIGPQLQERMPWALGFPVAPMTCGTCAHFDPVRGWCNARTFETQARLPSCDAFDAKPLEAA